MRRRKLIILLLIWLALSGLIVAMWIRSNTNWDSRWLGFPSSVMIQRAPLIYSSGGALVFTRATYQAPDGRFSMQANAQGVAIPYPAMLAAIWLLPVLWFSWNYRRTSVRLRDGRCKNCGYDLRASRDRCRNAERLWVKVKDHEEKG